MSKIIKSRSDVVLDSVAALKKYAGSAKAIEVKCFWAGQAVVLQSQKWQGIYERSSTSITENGGTVIHDLLGRSWVLKKTDGNICAKNFGAKANYKTETNTGDDDGDAFQKFFDSIAPTGGRAYVSKGNYLIGKTLRNTHVRNWQKFEFYADDDVLIKSNFAGAIFEDSSQAAFVKGIHFDGPSKFMPNSKAFFGQLTLGKISFCRFTNFQSGFYVTMSAGGAIENNNIGSCFNGVQIEDTVGNLSNIINISGNYISFCTNGVFLRNCYGINFNLNKIEHCERGLYGIDAREINIDGVNWFELNTVNAIKLEGSCTGSISEYTHIIGNGISIDYINSAVNNKLNKSEIVLNQNAQKINSGTVPQSLTWDSFLSDPNTMFEQGTNIKIKSRGWYSLNVNVQLVNVPSNIPDGSFLYVNIYKNGVILVEDMKTMVKGFSNSIAVNVERVKLLSGDAVGVQVAQNSGVALFTSGNQKTQFEVILEKSEY